MEKRGNAIIGIGLGVGEDRAIEAARAAVSSPLLETSIEGATDAIINITGHKHNKPTRATKRSNNHLSTIVLIFY